jgi:lipoprotein-releasing system permease protein
MDLGLEIGGSVNLIVPGKSGQTAKVEAFEVAGFIETATEVDSSLVLLPLDRAAHFLNFGSARVSGIRAQLKDVFEASSLARELRFTLEPTQYVRHWGMTHGNLYAAIQLSRDLIVILVAAVVFIAAFNVISSLVLLVTDKQKEIAMLATMGAEPGHIISIFLYLGALIGLIGSVVGGFLGALLAFNITAMVGFVEHALDVQFLNTDVYPIAFLPSDPRLGDFVLVVVVGLVACILAAIYPAIRAARLQPATVLTEV